jgi:hypothetical protein
MLSLGTMIYIIARTVPRIGDEVSEEIIRPKTKFDRLFASSRFEKLDVIFNNFVEKLLRKVKLLLMKLDNFTTSYLDKVKKYKLGDNSQKNGEEKPSLFNNNSKE